MCMLFGLEFWAVTFSFLGKLLIGVTALLVHRAVEEEGSIDTFVIKEMKIETSIGVVAILFLVAGYVLDIILLYA